MDLTFVIPGTSGPTITVRRSLFGGVSALVGDAPLRKQSRWRQVYVVPLDDGTTKTMTLFGGYTGLKAKVDGVVMPLERPLTPVEVIVVLLPFALIAVGGALGGGIGAIAVVANGTVMRSGMGLAARLGTAVLNVILAALAWYFIVGLVRNLIP